MRRFVGFFALFCLFSLTLPDLSHAEKAASPKKAEEALPAENPFLWKSTVPLTLSSVLSHFELFDAKLTSLSAHFTQSLSVEDTGMTSLVEGTVEYRKPDRLRIEHTRPERQTVVADGKNIWIYRHSRGQVIQSNLQDWKDSDPTINNLMQFGSYGKMLRTYDVSLDTRAALPVLELRAKAKKKSDFILRLELSRETLFPETTDLTVGSIRVRTHLDDIRYNPEFKKDRFRFTPPAGADVFRNFKPPKLQP